MYHTIRNFATEEKALDYAVKVSRQNPGDDYIVIVETDERVFRVVDYWRFQGMDLRFFGAESAIIYRVRNGVVRATYEDVHPD